MIQTNESGKQLNSKPIVEFGENFPKHGPFQKHTHITKYFEWNGLFDGSFSIAEFCMNSTFCSAFSLCLNFKRK